MQNNFYLAIGLTLAAGLSTGIGSCIAFFAKKTNKKFLSVTLGFSAGVMLYISFVEIFFKGQKILTATLGSPKGQWLNTLCFFAGIAVIAIIDKLVPEFENPHEHHLVEELSDNKSKNDFNKLHKTGIMTALAIGIHNFPEGLATFISTLHDPIAGISIAFAIAIHNIPEGIAVSIPVFYATGSRKKAFAYSFLSGISEPIGALVGYFLILPFMSEIVMGCIFGFIAGIMVFISLDQLLPAAREYGEHHLSIYGLIAGMAVMAISLLLFL